jgi:hypothetical protein
VFVHRRRRCAILMLEKRRSVAHFFWHGCDGVKDLVTAISSRPVLIRFFC